MVGPLDDFNRRPRRGVALYAPSMRAAAPRPAAPQVSGYNPLLDAIPNRTEKEEDDGGSFGRGLGYVLNNPVTQGILKPLEILDIGRRGVNATLKELNDFSQGTLLMGLGNTDDASFGDWWENMGDASFGFGDVVKDINTGNETFDKWANRGVGLVGDLATDPLTYFTAGVAPAAGKGYRTAKLADLLTEQRRLARAASEGVEGAAEQLAKLGGEEGLERIGRRGLSVASDAQLKAMDLPGQGFRLRNPITGTEWSRPIGATPAKALNEATGFAREQIKRIPGAKAIRATRSPKGFLEQDLTPAFERILTGKGGGRISDAIEEVAFDNMLRESGGTFNALAVNELDQLAKQMDGMTEPDFARLRAEAAAGTENILTNYAQKVRQIASSPLVGGSIQEIDGGILYSMPQVMSRKFRDRLRTAFENNDVRAQAFMRETGITTRDLLEESGFRQKRAFRPGESVKIGDDVVDIVDGTVDELNAKFGALFPDFEGKIYETNPLMAYRQYIRGVTRDVAKTAAGRRAAREGFENVKKAGPAPATFDPASGRQNLGDDVGMGATRTPGEFQENEFYRGGADKKATEKRNKSLISEQTKVLRRYRRANAGGRVKLANDVRTTVKEILDPARKARDRLRRHIKKIEDGVAAESDAVRQMQFDLEEVQDQINALESYRSAIRDGIGDELDETFRSVLGDAAAQRDELLSEIASMKAQYDKLINDLAVPAKARSDEAAQRAARLEGELEELLPTEDARRRAEEALAAASGVPKRQLTDAERARLDEVRQVLTSDEYKEYLELSEQRRQLFAGRTGGDLAAEQQQVDELTREAAAARTAAALASKKGRQQSMLRQAKDLRRQARKINEELIAGADNLANLSREMKYHRESSAGFRTKVAQSVKARYLEALDARESARNKMRRLLAEAEGIEASATRIRDRKTLPELRQRSDDVHARLQAAEKNLKDKRAAASKSFNKRLAKLDKKLDAIPPKIRNAVSDAFEISGQAPPLSRADLGAMREANLATAEADRLAAAQADMPVAHSGKELRFLREEAEAAVNKWKSHLNAIETEFRAAAKEGGKSTYIPDDAARSQLRYIRDNPNKMKAYRRLLSEKERLTEIHAKMRFGSNEKREAAVRLNNLSQKIKKDFEELRDAMDTVGKWRSQRAALQRRVDHTLRVDATNTVRRYKEALARMEGGPKQSDVIKALREKSGEYDKVVEQINRYVGDPLEDLQRQLDEIETPVRGQVAEQKASSAVLDERAAEELTVRNMQKQMIEDRMAEQIVREQFDHLEDIGRSRQELARVERSLEEGKTAVAVGGKQVNPKAPTKASQMRKALDDAHDVARQNPDMTDETLSEIEKKLTEHAKMLDELDKVDMTEAELQGIIKEAKAGKLGPVVTARLRQEWKYLVPGEDIVISQRMAGMFRNIDAVNKQPALFGRTLTAFTNFFKTYAVMTPGFHVRNAMSAIFMNLADGVRFGTQNDGLQLWRQYLKSDDPLVWLERQSKEVQDAFKATFASGAGGRFLESGVAEAGEGAGRFREKLYSNWATVKSQKAGGYIEGAVRMGMALDSARRGQSVSEALERLSRVHFDYSQVSKFDESAKRLIPFWTFMSRNLPTQTVMMWTKPRIYNYYQSVIRNISEEPDPLTPEYWLRQGAFNIGGNFYLDPDLAHTRVLEDAERFAKLGEGDFNPMLSNFNPFFTAPIEYFTGQNLFTGYTVDPDETRDVGLLDVPAAILGAPFGKTYRRDDGSWAVNERIASALQSTIPDLDRAHRLAPGASGQDFRTGTTIEGWLRWGGAPFRQLTDERRRSEARRQGREERDRLAMEREIARG